MRTLLLLCICALFVGTFSLSIKKRESVNGQQLHGPEPPRQLQETRDLNINGAIEITGNFEGYITEQEGSKTYFVSLDVHEVADVYIEYPEGDFNGYAATMNIYLRGATDNWNFYGNTSSNPPNTLAMHCPEFATTYYIELTPYNFPANFSFYMSKKSSNFVAGASNYTGVALFPETGYIGVPVTTECQALVLDITFSAAIDSSYVSLNYLCRSYNYDCIELGDYQYIFVGAEILTGQSSKHYQLYANCTEPGVYYIGLYTSNSLQYNITVHDDYPCPYNCWLGGFCNLANGTCMCNPGYSGEDCSIYSGASSNVNYTVVDLYADGTTYTLSPADVYASKTMFRLNYVPNPQQLVRVQLYSPPTEYFIYIYAYFNLGSYALQTNNSGYTIIYNPVGTAKEAQLCATSGPWYLYTYAYSDQSELQITVDLVTIPVISGSSFQGAIPPSYNFYSPVVYQIKPPSANMVIQVNETFPQLNGIAVYSQCLLFFDYETSYAYAYVYPLAYDRNFGYGRYQLQTASLNTSQSYYLLISGNPGATFTGAVQSGSAYCNKCGPHGFCSQYATCICRNGYSGDNCSTITFPGPVTQLDSVSTTTVTLPSQLFYEAITYLATPLIPVGYAIKMEAVADTNVSFFVSSSAFPIASQVESATFSIVSNEDNTAYYAFSGCVATSPQQYYIALAPQHEAGGVVNITITLTSITLPLDGTPITVRLTENINAFHAKLPADCSGAYFLIIDGLTSGYATFGESNAYCFSQSEQTVQNYQNGTSASLLQISNCSNSLDLKISSSSSSPYYVNISISPTIPCPNQCNGNGACQLGGTCSCSYPFIGVDCGTMDTTCYVLPDNGSCQSNAPSTYDGNFDDSENFCNIQYDSNEYGLVVSSYTSELRSYGYYISTSCQKELLQIFCDSSMLKCQNQPCGGVKLLLPCNAETWISRCTPGYNGGALYDLLAIQTYSQNLIASAPGFFLCNPSPFNYSQYPGTTTYTTRSSTSISTLSSSSGSSSPSSSSTTTSPNDSSRINEVYWPVCILFLIAAMFM